MKILFKDLKSTLQQSNVFFTIDGRDRIKDNDFLLVGNSTTIEPYVSFLNGFNLCSMGSFSYSWSNLPPSMKVGRYCSIARGLSILGTRHPYEWLTTSSSTYDKNFIIFKKFKEDIGQDIQTFSRPNNPRKHGVIIGHDVWIGANVVLKDGIRIGTGSVIAAHSVVVKDVPPYSIVGGNPAKIIKNRFSDYQIIRLLESEWWNYSFDEIQAFDIRNIDSFLDKFETIKYELSPFKPKPLIL